MSLAGCAGGPHAGRDFDLAIVDATLIDPRTEQVQAQQTLLIRDGRIVTRGASARTRVPSGTPRVDVAGKYVIPGLWDMHAHTLWEPVVRETFLPLFVAHGVTGVRDMGGTLAVLEQVRRDEAAGERPWPRLVAPGPILDGPQPVDPSISLAIDSPEAASAAVARLADAGVDFIKVYTLLPPPAYRAAVLAAKERGLPVAGHIPHRVAVVEAASGMRSIEHQRAETGGLCAELSATDCDAAYAALREHGTWQTPTLVARRPRAMLDEPSFPDEVPLAYVPASLRAVWLGNRERALQRSDTDARAARRAEFAREVASAGALPDRGLRVLAGSDAGSDFVVPGWGLHEELALLASAGLTPWQVLRAATSEAADYLGRDDIGHLEPGAVADLVILDGDPLQDIRNTGQISAVVLRGRVLDRSALDAILAGVGSAAEAR